MFNNWCKKSYLQLGEVWEEAGKGVWRQHLVCHDADADDDHVNELVDDDDNVNDDADDDHVNYADDNVDDNDHIDAANDD